MPCWAHQRQLSYQPKQEKEFTQKPRMDTGRLGRLGRKRSGTVLGRLVGRGQIRMMRSFRPPRIPGLKAITTHRIIGISTMGKRDGRKKSSGWLKEKSMSE